MIILETRKGNFIVATYDFDKFIKTKDKVYIRGFSCINEGMQPNNFYLLYEDLINWYNIGTPEFFYRRNLDLLLKLIKNKSLQIISKGD